MIRESHDGGFVAWWSNHPDLTGLTPHGVAQLAWNAARSESADTERLKEALRQVKSWVVGEKLPNWENDTTTYLSRGKIADICDIALAYPQHPRDLHLDIAVRGSAER